MAEAKKRGRPSSFREEYCDQAKKLSRLGLTDVEMAKYFEVSEKTLNTWKIKHPEFFQSLKEGKEFSDARVAQSLFHRAIGYSHPAVKIMVVDKVIQEIPYTEHYPPDTTAAIFWLKNRQPDKWRAGNDQQGGEGPNLVDPDKDI